MKRAVLAMLPFAAMVLITACASGVRQSETHPATAGGPQQGRSTSAAVAAAKACAAMKEVMGTWQDHFDERMVAPIDTSDLRRQVSDLRAVDTQSKWTGLESQLDILADDVNAAPDSTHTPMGVAAEANNATYLCSLVVPGATSPRIPTNGPTTVITQPAVPPATAPPIPACAPTREMNTYANSTDTKTVEAVDLFAKVSADGQVEYGSCGIQVKRVSTGRYEVMFSQDVSQCAAVANLGYVGTQEGPIPRPAAVTLAYGPGNHSVTVDVVDPGAIPRGGGYPNNPELVDESFQLHVDCSWEYDSVVRADGTQVRGSPGVTTRHLGVGRYAVSFPIIGGCAQVATVNTTGGSAEAVQAFLAYGTTPNTVEVGINRSDTTPVDAAFSIIDTCLHGQAVYTASDGSNRTSIPDALGCALTASWISTTPGGPPSDQGYVATWAADANTAVVQTKNGRYSIATGFGVDIVATC